MPPPPIQITFYYDIVSTYSYFAFEILLRYEQLWNLQLDLQPTSLATVFKLTGTIPPPLASEFKRLYMFKDLERVSKEYQVPLKIGLEFPGNSSRVMRLLHHLKDNLSPSEFKLVTRHYFRENFVVNTPMSSPSFLTSLLTASNLTPTSITHIQTAISYTDSHQSDLANLLRTEAKSLVDTYGAFGFPWIVVHKSNPNVDGNVQEKEQATTTNCWFGSDRFANIAWWLGPEYPWLGPVPATATAPKASL